MTGFRVEADQLDRQASHLAGVADQLAGVAARLPAGLGEQTLGSFAQFLTAGLRSATDSTADAVAHAAATTDAMALGMSRTAEDYRRTEDRNTLGFTGEDRR